ncbi:MAG: pyruvate, phosphate dikinase [bacterium]|nr:pyruvate, phosphate dikinase [bacterium]
MKKKFVYFFGQGKAEGNAKMKDLLGGKGAGLAEMTNIGVPVPPGFTITTETCILYNQAGKNFPDGLEDDIRSNMAKLEEIMEKGFGYPGNPLLVSVRSGAAASMPGMMDTVLNLGLNDETVQGLVEKTGNERFAYDAYRRFIQMFSDIVLGLEHADFERLLEKMKEEEGVKFDSELNRRALQDLVRRYKGRVRKVTGADFPTDPWQQLTAAIKSVFDSWETPRAVTYRKMNNIPHDMGTGVNVQTMVFGNMGETSGTGVAFTRNPSTGKKQFYGEYLLDAQGEDVVAGIRTPHPILQLKEEMPDAYDQLVEVYQRLEQHYRDMQDIEFTIENHKLFMLQTRTGKRTAKSAVKIAVDMEQEGLIDKREAILRVEPATLDQLLHPHIDPEAKVDVIAKGLAASPGAAAGQAVFTADDACDWAAEGKKVVLVRSETSPEDIHGMYAAEGILTARGGMTSHAAVVARGMGKCCVAGCEAIKVNEETRSFKVGDLTISEGDMITLDGTTGRVILGEAPTIESEMTEEMVTFLSWTDDFRKLKVRTNADTPEDAKKARNFGAQGIGLCRTEHMFFGEERLPHMQAMIVAKDKKARENALAKLLPMQKEDFRGIFLAMEGLPVTIRLLDPPLHEFLPNHEELSVELAELKVKGENNPDRIKELEEIIHQVEGLRESNPMLGHRGCRLGITMPEVYEMQVQAIFEAATELVRDGYVVEPEVMVPLVGHVNELKVIKKQIVKIADEVIANAKVDLNYSIGTMIELPRAAITADEIAGEAEFFSFGTNDLTQTTFGFSRDDAEGKFLGDYLDQGILPANPFQQLDQTGVGELIQIGVTRGRSTRPDLKVGICGEHGGDPSSIEFCHLVGLNYVSCSPFRVPIARLAAAHARLKNE